MKTSECTHAETRLFASMFNEFMSTQIMRITSRTHRRVTVLYILVTTETNLPPGWIQQGSIYKRERGASSLCHLRMDVGPWALNSQED
jgi:hypothetical protein